MRKAASSFIDDAAKRTALLFFFGIQGHNSTITMDRPNTCEKNLLNVAHVKESPGGAVLAGGYNAAIAVVAFAIKYKRYEH